MCVCVGLWCNVQGWTRTENLDLQKLSIASMQPFFFLYWALISLTATLSMDGVLSLPVASLLLLAAVTGDGVALEGLAAAASFSVGPAPNASCSSWCIRCCSNFSLSKISFLSSSSPLVFLPLLLFVLKGRNLSSIVCMSGDSLVSPGLYVRFLALSGLSSSSNSSNSYVASKLAFFCYTGEGRSVRICDEMYIGEMNNQSFRHFNITNSSSSFQYHKQFSSKLQILTSGTKGGSSSFFSSFSHSIPWKNGWFLISV